jgi:glycosyltransferase involved in cell wall biosynthesis
MNNKRLSLIIPTYNKCHRLKYLVESLSIQKADFPFEIILVDDGSSDKTRELIESYLHRVDIQYIYQSNGGRSHARNRGLAEATGEYVVFIDDDMILPEYFLQSHYNALLENPGSLIHGRIWNLPFLSFFKDPATGVLFEHIPKTNSNLDNIRKYLIDLDVVHHQGDLEKQRRTYPFEKYLKEIYDRKISQLEFLMCTGGNFSCPREALLDVKGFSEDLDFEWGAEDLELGYKLKQNHIGFVFAELAFNYHISHYRMTYEKELRNSISLFYSKYRDPVIQALPELLLRKYANLDEFISANMSWVKS